MVKKSDEVLATGRRKCAVARVRMTPGTGKIVVNGKEMAEYFPSEALCGYVMQVLKVSETEGKLDIAANIDGGGVAGQAGALRYGVARALVKMDENLRAVLKANGMMTRDARVKERKKPGSASPVPVLEALSVRNGRYEKPRDFFRSSAVFLLVRIQRATECRPSRFSDNSRRCIRAVRCGLHPDRSTRPARHGRLPSFSRRRHSRPRRDVR